MQSNNKHVQEFLESVCNEIRFKGIRKNIAKELSDHIEDQKNEYIKQGIAEETAVLKAVEQMGDPVIIGKRLDKAHRPKTEWSILALAAILVVLGGIIQFFLSKVNAHSTNMFSHFLLYAPIGIVVFAIMYFFDYTLLGRYSKIAYFTLLAITFSGFFILNTYHGAHTHVYFLMLLFIPVFAGVIYGMKNKGYLGIVFCGLFYACAAFMCFFAPSTPGLFLLTISCLAILTVSIVKGFFGGNVKVSLAIVYVPFILMLILFGLAIPSTSHYIFERIMYIVNPGHDLLRSGWQSMHIKQLLASSVPIGKVILEGPIANMPFTYTLPCWETYFSLTYVIARFGYLAGMAIVAIMVIFIIRMFISVLKQKSAYGFLVSFSACLALTGQIVLYVLFNIGIIGSLAITVPFISFGAFGFIANMALVGLLLSVHRRTDLVNDRLQNVRSSAPLFTITDGKLIIDLGIKAADNLNKIKDNI